MSGINLSKEQRSRYCEFGVVFTRSASVDQAGENQALKNQKRICEEHAKRMNVKILQYFGGIKTNNKNNARSEIIRMHYFLEKHGFIVKVLLTTPDRLEGRLKEYKDLQDQLLNLSIELAYCLPYNKW